jgi:hypothetical protein
MSIAITTLNNAGSVAKTFNEVSKDRTTGEWINVTDSTATKDIRLTIKQSQIGKTSTGVPIQRSLVQATAKAPTTLVVNGQSTSVEEVITINLTQTRPRYFAALSAGDPGDLLAYVKNLVNGSMLEQLARGEV